MDNSGGGPGVSYGGGQITAGGGVIDSLLPPVIRQNIAKTGDESQLLRYLLLFAVSLAGLAALLFFGVFRRGRKKDGDK